ncbi:MAG: hypothetical protein K9W43_10215 [Candidatus Thorarchaeota archaeon]|nr:hypothetical protein [Candidatus Thorarchaeota archaeon]
MVRMTTLVPMILAILTISVLSVPLVAGGYGIPSPTKILQQDSSLSLDSSLGSLTDIVIQDSAIVAANGKMLEVHNFTFDLLSSIKSDSPIVSLELLDSGNIVSFDLSGNLRLYSLNHDTLTQNDQYSSDIHWSNIQGGRWFFTALNPETQKTQVFTTFHDTIQPVFTFNTTEVSVSGDLAVTYEHGNFTVWNLTNPSKPVHILDIDLYFEQPYWFRLHDTMIAYCRQSGYLEPVFSILDFSSALGSSGNVSTVFHLSSALLSPVVWTDDYLLVKAVPSSLSKYNDGFFAINMTSPTQISISGFLNGTTAEEIQNYATVASEGTVIAGIGVNFIAIWNLTAVPPHFLYKEWSGGYVSDMVFTDGLDAAHWGGDQYFTYPMPLTSGVSVLCDASDLMVVGDHLFHARSKLWDSAPVTPVPERIDKNTISVPWSHTDRSTQGFRPQGYNGFVYMIAPGSSVVTIYRWNVSDGNVGGRESVKTITMSGTDNITAFCMDGSMLYMLGKTGGYVCDVNTSKVFAFTASFDSAPDMVKVVNGSMFILDEHGLVIYKIDRSQASSLSLDEIGNISTGVQTFTVDKNIIAVANSTHVCVYSVLDSVSGSGSSSISIIGSIEVPILPHTEYPSGITPHCVCDLILDAEHMVVYRAAGHLGVGTIHISTNPSHEVTQDWWPLTNLLIGGAVLIAVVALVLILRRRYQ